MQDEILVDDLMALVGDHLEWDLDRRARAFARRASLRIRARNLEARFPVRSIVHRSSSEADSRCAPLLDLAVAAGIGRELWEEQCESWIELPRDIPDSRYLALRVAGDSMVPVLRPRDVILVKLGAHPLADDLVVAQRPDDGYVVKRVASVTPRELELDSLNPLYDPIRVPLEENSVLGTVIARFREM